MVFPKVSEPGKKEGEKLSEKKILSLKLLDLEGLLLRKLSMKSLFLDVDPVTIETDIFLIGIPYVKSLGGAAAHWAPRQEPPRPGVLGHPHQKSEKKERR